MYWKFKKIKETNDYVIYKYGRESSELTGEILIYKKDYRYIINKVADDDSEFSIQHSFSPHFKHIVIDMGCPDEDMIATG